jgi:hypothetical protein
LRLYIVREVFMELDHNVIVRNTWCIPFLFCLIDPPGEGWAAPKE